MTIQEDIYKRLENLGLDYRKVHHKAVTTSEAAAEARGLTIEGDAKALLLKAKDTFVIMVLQGNKQLDWKAARKILGGKLRMATAEELLEQTGLVKGCLPPFGNVVGFQTYIDNELVKQPKVGFNVGVLTDSVVMNGSDLQEATEGIMADFAVPGRE